MSALTTGTYQYPFVRSMIVMYLAVPIRSMMSLIGITLECGVAGGGNG